METAKEAGDMLVFNRKEFCERLLGDEQMVDLVLAGFLRDLPGQISRLEEHLSNGQAGAARMQAHTLKGAAANVSAARLRAAALEIEQAARAGDLESAGAACRRLKAEFMLLVDTLKQ